MSGNQRYQPYAGNPARLNTYHGPKRQLLGNHTAGRAAPSWRSNAIPEEAAAAQAAAKRVTIRNLSGSKILLSCLPNDVSESDITVCLFCGLYIWLFSSSFLFYSFCGCGHFSGRDEDYAIEALLDHRYFIPFHELRSFSSPRLFLLWCPLLFFSFFFPHPKNPEARALILRPCFWKFGSYDA